MERFAGELRGHFGVRHCFLVSSGKAALTLILAALKERYPGRDEVLIPAFNCYSVPSAIVRAGLKVALCDIDSRTLDFDFEQLRRKLENPKLLCVMPTHLFGLPANVTRVRELIGDRPIPVVEDAAQAMGGEWNGRKLGTLGDLGFFSLGRGKALSTVEGGVILTDCGRTADLVREKIREMEGYGVRGTATLFLYALALLLLMRPSLFWFPRALPFLKLGETIFDPAFPVRRMGGFQAGLAAGWARKLDALQKGRRAEAREWIESVPSRFRIPGAAADASPIRFPVRTASPEEARRLAAEGDRYGLGIARTYPDAVSGIAELAGLFQGEDCPAARAAAREIVTLPVHQWVNRSDRENILKSVTRDA